MSVSVVMVTMFAMLIYTITTQMVLIFVLAKKDTPEMNSHVNAIKSSLQYFSTSGFAYKRLPMEISPHFGDLLSRTTLVFLLPYFLYITYASRYRRMQQWKP